MYNQNHQLFEDMFNMVCGDKLGSGAYRDVYAHKFDKDLVIKVEQDRAHRSFANVLEHYFWNEAPESTREWLAPAISLSPDGLVSFQKRTCALPYDFQFPDKLPRFLRDIKPENFGLYKGRLVCHDYQMLNIKFDNQLKKYDNPIFYQIN